MAKGRIARVPAGSEDIGFGLDNIEADLGDIGFDLGDNGMDFEGTGLQDIVLGALAVGAVHPGSALVGLYTRPEVAFDCCIPGWAGGYRLGLLLLPWVGQPLRFSLADRLQEQVLWWY